MAVYYKFKSAKDYDSIAVDGHFINVGNLKDKIFQTKHLGRGTDFDLVVTNAQTNEEYLDEDTLIPKNTSVLIRRVPGRPRMPIVTAPAIEQAEPEVENNTQAANTSFLGADPSENPEDIFGNDLYASTEFVPAQSSIPVQDAPPPSKDDEASKLQAFIDTPSLDWQHQSSDGFGIGRGFGRGMGGRMGGRGFGRGFGMERKIPPPGYVCHRCKTPGHYIQHCHTNGDPAFDIKKVKPPTGIPRSMLMATPDGSYALPSGAVAVLKPNEAAFEKEIEGMPSTRSVGDLPPELHCPLCRQVMKDAVLTSKCCFKSFCDKCIRDYIISKSMCVCGASNVLADDLLPNKTLRDTINRILESNNSSGENGGSFFQVQDMESARCPPPKPPSPALSVASKGEQAPPQNEVKNTKIQEMIEPVKVADAPQQTLDKVGPTKVADIPEATHESRSVKEPAPQGSAPVGDEEVQQKPVSGEAGKKKKKKKARLPLGAAEMQWRGPQDFGPENYMMPMGPAAYNPYWTGMQPGMEAFGGPYGGPMPPYMGYGLGPSPMDAPFGGVFPPDPFAAQAFMMGNMPGNMPFPPQRDLPEYGMGFGGPHMMGREEFEARQADIRRKRELERRGGSRELSKDHEFRREMSSSGDPSMKSKSKSIPLPPPSADHHHQGHLPRPRSERPSPDRYSHDPEPPRTSSKRKSSEYDHYEDQSHHHREREHRRHHKSESSSAARPPIPPATSSDLPPKSSTISDKKQKASVFSRISFPEGESGATKKRKVSGSSSGDGSGHHHREVSNGYHEDKPSKGGAVAAVSRKSASAAVDYESSDEDRHFKRRPSRYEASPPPVVEEVRHSSRGSRERDRGHSSKHR